MNRTSFKSFSRVAMSMTTIAISIAAILSLTGCGSTGGSLSKTSDGGVASTGSHGAGSGGATATGSGTSTAPTNTGTNSISPNASAKQSATNAWTGLVGGVGNIVVQGGDTVAGIGTTLMLPSLDGGKLDDNVVSSILTGTGGAVVGVGDALTAGLDGVVNGENAVELLALGADKAAGQVGIDVGEVGTAVSSAGTMAPNVLVVSPTIAALGQTIYSTGGSFSAIQFESAALLTDGTVQQVTGALKPVLYPLATGSIETVSAVGDGTGLGAPLDTLITETGDAVASGGAQFSSASSAPALQGLGGVVTATGETVAAVGGVVHDGQPSTITSIAAISTTSSGTFDGVTGTLAELPGGSALVSTLSGGKAIVTPALSSVVAGLGSASALGSSASPGSTVVATVNPVITPIVAITGALPGLTSGSGTASSLPLLTPVLATTIAPVTAPVIAQVSSVVSGTLSSMKTDALPSLSTTVTHAGH